MDVQLILSRAQGSPHCHSIRTFGEENPDKVFYVIWREGVGSGFFSNVFHVLGHLLVADALDMTPVVDMKNRGTLYNEADPVNGTRNAWEYYFAQPGGTPLQAVYKSKYVVFCNGAFIWSIYDDIDTPEWLIRKYLHIHDPVRQFADDFVREFFTDKQVLGIHFRGQEQKAAPQHPTPALPEQIIESTRMLLRKYPIN